MSAAASPSSPLMWSVLELFYSARASYLQVHDRYEGLVAEYVKTLGKPRTDIRLGPKQLAELLRFKELERLRDRLLAPLKDSCHTLFRGADSTDFLDRLVNDIFHEISILKEEHYNVLTYEPSATGDTHDELDAILDEVHTMFPQKVHRIRHLFEVGRGRLEKLLPDYKQDRVVIRSLFLERGGFVAEAYPDGLVRFYRCMYGEKRPQEGFVEVGDSFLASGFLDQAIDGYREGLRFLKSVPAAGKRALDPSWKDTRRRLEESIGECEVRRRDLAAEE